MRHESWTGKQLNWNGLLEHEVGGSALHQELSATLLFRSLHHEVLVALLVVQITLYIHSILVNKNEVDHS